MGFKIPTIVKLVLKMLRKNLFGAYLPRKPKASCNTCEITASLLRKRRTYADIFELILWTSIMAIAGYVLVSQLIKFVFKSTVVTSTGRTLNTVSNGQNGDGLKDSMQFNIQLLLQLHEDFSPGESSDDGDNENTKIKVLLGEDATVTQFVVPKSLRYSRGKSKPSNESGEDAVMYSNAGIHHRKMLKLVCSAPFPIEFKYDGFGYPSFKVSVEKRTISESFILSMYIITLSFKNDLPQELESGRYTCQAMESESARVTVGNDVFVSVDQYDEERLPRHMDLYVPGEMKLLHESLENVDDHRLDGLADYDRGSGLEGINRTAKVIALGHDVAVDGEEITLPCGVSDPVSKVLLCIKDSTGFESQLNEQIGGPISYDFARGFRVPVHIIKNMMRRFQGPNFLCRIHYGGGVKELAFKIFLTDASNSHVTPSTRTVLASASNKPSLEKFECESGQPIMIKWLDGPPASVQHTETSFPNATTTYKLTFIATPSQFPDGASVARFQCVRSQDQIIIHTWKWIRNGVTKPLLTWDGKEKKLSCCLSTSTRSNSIIATVADSLHAPQLLVKTCSTMLECQVKASFQPKMGSRGEAKSYDSNKTCAAWNVPNDFHTGLIMCTAVNRMSAWGKDGGNDLLLLPVGAAAGDDDGSPSTRGEIPPVIVKWNDDVVILRNGGMDANLSLLKRLTTITVVEGSLPHGDSSGNQSRYIRVQCLASSTVFTKGFRWTMHMNSGKIVENVHRQTTWEGEQGIIIYREHYEQRKDRILGVLQIRMKEYTKPLLSFIHDENSTQTEGFATLRMTDIIGIVKCEVPLWNDTDIWVASFTDVHF